jgi:hypothetical protein
MTAKVTMSGKTVSATVLLSSLNRKSLLLAFDDALTTKDGGMYVGSVPLLWDEDQKTYVDLATGTPAEVQWI